MTLKHVTTGLVFLLLCTAATAAPDKDRKPAGKDDDNGVQIIIRSEAEKKRRQNPETPNANNQNSNRQSDPDSNRGLERAEERRPEQAGQQSEGAWYENIFGQRKKPGDKKDDESSWWWPFD